MVAAGGIAAAGSIAGGMMSGSGKKGKSGGYIPQPQEQWLPETAPTLSSMWDYMGKGMQALSEGKPPTWFQRWAPLEEAQRKNKLRGTYWGSGAGAAGGEQFGPGILQTTQAADIKAGRRGSGAGSNYNKQLAEYAQRESEIGDYMTKTGAMAMEGAEGRYLQAASQLPRGMKMGYGQFEGTPYQPSGWESAANALGAAAPYWGDAINNMPTSTTPGPGGGAPIEFDPNIGGYGGYTDMDWMNQWDNQRNISWNPGGR